MRPSVLIFNPKAGRHGAAKRLPQLLHTLHQGGFDVEPTPTTGPGDAGRLAAAAAAAGAEVVFAMGGDGTLREAAAGLLGGEATLGPLPAGTTNVLALELGVPRHPLRAARVLGAGAARSLDVGMAGDEPFLMMASGGADAAVMANINAPLKRWLGFLGVTLGSLGTLLRYDHVPIRLRVDGEEEEVTFFAACNIPYYAGRLRMVPSARTDDGLLDLVTFTGRNRGALAGLGRDLLFGRHLKRRDVRLRQVAELEVLGPLPWGLQVDGDVLAVDLPVHIRVEPAFVRVLALR